LLFFVSAQVGAVLAPRAGSGCKKADDRFFVTKEDVSQWKHQGENDRNCCSMRTLLTGQQTADRPTTRRL